MTPVSRQGAVEKREQTKRYQIDFTDEVLRHIDRIRAKLGFSTRAMVVRNALRMYQWFTDEVDPDDIVTIKDKDGVLVAQFRAELLLK